LLKFHTTLNVKIRDLKVLVQETQENVEMYCVKDVVEAALARVPSIGPHDQTVPDCGDYPFCVS
jgi:hypothetical protein